MEVETDALGVELQPLIGRRDEDGVDIDAISTHRDSSLESSHDVFASAIALFVERYPELGFSLASTCRRVLCDERIWRTLTRVRRGAWGRTPLSAAAKFNDSSRVSWLCRIGAPLNATARDGSTALVAAAGRGAAEALAVLLRAGADVHVRDSAGRTALRAAADNGHIIALQQLSVSSVINARDNDGWSSLMGAASFGRTDCVLALIRAGADVEADGDCFRRRALHLAAAAGHALTVRALLTAGRADATARSKCGRDALSWAIDTKRGLGRWKWTPSSLKYAALQQQRLRLTIDEIQRFLPARSRQVDAWDQFFNFDFIFPSPQYRV